MIISVCSVKGGVGKTSTSVNLAGAISRRRNKPNKVLIVDLDLQGGATHHLCDGVGTKHKFTLLDYVLGKCDEESVICSYSKNLDIIPISFGFSKMSDEDFSNPLGNLLEKVDKKYDFVFLDLSPAICKASTVPLSFSDSCIIPVHTKGGLSLLGLDAQVKVVFEMQDGGNKKLDILGVLPTFAGRTRMCKEVLEYLKEKCEEDLFLSVIRENTHLSEAASTGKLIFDHAPRSNGAKDYDAFCDEFLKRVKKRNKK